MSDSTPITPTARLWAAIQRRPHPPREWGRYKRALTSWKVGYAEVLRATPRPIRVWRAPGGYWRWACRLCCEYCPYPSHEVALRAALDHLHTHHGCPSRAITGEPCHPTCIHCRGWQWCAAPTTERSDW